MIFSGSEMYISDFENNTIRNSEMYISDVLGNRLDFNETKFNDTSEDKISNSMIKIIYAYIEFLFKAIKEITIRSFEFGYENSDLNLGKYIKYGFFIFIFCIMIKPIFYLTGFIYYWIKDRKDGKKKITT